MSEIVLWLFKNGPASTLEKKECPQAKIKYFVYKAGWQNIVFLIVIGQRQMRTHDQETEVQYMMRQYMCIWQMNIPFQMSGCIYHMTEIEEFWSCNRVEDIKKEVHMSEKTH